MGTATKPDKLSSIYRTRTVEEELTPTRGLLSSTQIQQKARTFECVHMHIHAHTYFLIKKINFLL